MRSAILLIFAISCFGQQPTRFTAADYARAEKWMGYNTGPLVFHAGVRPTWLAANRFWYSTNTPDGTQFVLLDAVKGTRAPLFDHARLAAGLTAAAGRPYDAKKLPAMEVSEDLSSATAGRWKCSLASYVCAAGEATSSGRRGGGNVAVSPDKSKTTFVRDFNLWMRDMKTGKETQLTTDGVKDFGYATDNAGWIRSDRPVVVWSPDSRQIATFQQDQRKTGEMYLVDTRVGHPKLQAWKYPLAGDKDVTMIQPVVIDVAGPRVVRVKVGPEQHRSSLCDDIECRGGEWADVQWSADSAQLAMLETSRDHKAEKLHIVEAETGAVRDSIGEVVSTFFESGNGRVNWRYMKGSNEIIWFSEKSNWGHLYLHDLATGQLKNAITSGEWNVTELLRVDQKNRMLYFLGVGRETGQDPYYVHFYRVGFDGKGLTLLTPEDGTHEVSVAPAGDYFVDTYSKPDVAPVTVLRAADGKLISTLEKADITKLLAAGWKAPESFTVKARDGKTDLYGLMFKPTNFDANRKYPIINNIYPGPQTGSIGSRSFSASRRDCQALAELGFIVVQIDGMGTPWRSKKFHEAYFGDLGDNTLPDQVTGMKQLAAKYSWIDLDKVGVYGHSGGGYATAGAMFHYPDFFKVGISEAGNHDNRNYEDDWAEKWQGLVEVKADGKSNYDSQANQNFAKNLKGHLLLAHGTMDVNVPPYNTLLVVDELIKANKDFDLLMLPNRGHGFGNEPYMVRRRWDYFVRYLLGAEPPVGYELHAEERPQ